MFGETTIFHVIIWSHPTETTHKHNNNCLFGVPGEVDSLWPHLSHGSTRFDTSQVVHNIFHQLDTLPPITKLCPTVLVKL